MSTTEVRLVADVGGTHTRFALSRGSEFIDAPRTLSTRAFSSLGDAARSYLEQTGVHPHEACFAVAGPIDADTVRLTNHCWEFSQRALARELGIREFRVINDFEAIALAVPHLADTEVVQIGGDMLRPDRPLAVLGPGTGLGVAQLIPVQGGFRAVPTEGGHASIGPVDHAELQIIATLIDDGIPVSRESLLSGPGIERLYHAVSLIRSGTADSLSAAEIQVRAVAGSDPSCSEALAHFCAFLGTAAADQALCTGAQGGVYIAGGIVPRFTAFLQSSRFRARFETSGPMNGWLRTIPVYVITHHHPGLLGAALAPIHPSEENRS